MIRREIEGAFWLFTQHDHAQLAGSLAGRFGNDGFAAPAPRAEVVEAVAMHDCGWPLHDDQPTLNAKGAPLDFFETSLGLAARIWTASVDRLSEAAPYAQLLVSLHVLGLSGFVAGSVKSRQEVFLLNKFQQRQIEMQERLRSKVGLATDIPLRLGLAEAHGLRDEAKLKRNHMILQLMDRISLALLCTKVVFPKVENVPDRVAGAPIVFTLTRSQEWDLRVEPWPFDAGSISFPIACKVLEAKEYASEQDFRSAYAAAERREVSVKIHA